MKTFKAKPVIVPSDLAEKFDKGTGHPEGYLRNMIAEKGKLHELEEEVLAIGLMSMVKGIMEDKDLPDSKPLSVERLSNVVFVTMFAYCTGTMHVDDDGDVVFGNTLDDIKTAIDLSLSDKIKFANGKTIPTEQFMAMLKSITEPKSLAPSYKRIVTRNGFSKTITPVSAFHLAKTSIVASKKFLEDVK